VKGADVRSIAAVATVVEVDAGVDTHLDLHHAAVLSLSGELLGTRSFATTRAGYRAMLAWFRSHGEVIRVGVEQTGTYGAGLTRHLALAGIPVLEVTGPDRAERRAKGKDDTLDAIAAAAALTGKRVSVAKDRAGQVEALRVLRTTRKTAVKCRRATLQQLRNTITAAPEEVRDQVRNLTRMQLLRTCASWRPDPLAFRDPATATKIALKSLARRLLDLGDEIAELDRLIAPLVAELAPACSSEKASGPRTPANCSSPPATTPTGSRPNPASRCPAAPVRSPPLAARPSATASTPAATARPTVRCTWIVVCRMRADQRTRDYVVRRLAEGKTKREIMHCLKRYVAREI
jgi:transposase